MTIPTLERTALLILDGWGHGPRPADSAIAQAHTPFMDSLYEKYPHTELTTFGEEVGLPEGQMGNSEVGHLNIGAGRIVYQELARIHKAIEQGALSQNETLKAALQTAKAKQQKVHLLGLVSDGGVHSHIRHLKALCDVCAAAGLSDIFVHAFTDGRDTAPQSAPQFLGDLLEHLQGHPAQLASIIGRYYAMDRDNRWERIKLAYDLLLEGKGEAYTDPLQAVQDAYEAGITDEFLKPIVLLNEAGQARATIAEGDLLIFFNFRTDRCRQIVSALTQEDKPEQAMHRLNVSTISMTRYDVRFTDVSVLFEKENLVNTLGDWLAQKGKSQLRIAETEKYPHVTFFFSGGAEQAQPGETRIIVNSPKVATYDLQPEMSAPEVAARAIAFIQEQQPDFVCLNFANTDMVGHTGVFEAAVKAAEAVDSQLEKLVNQLQAQNYGILIIADHGNADVMRKEDGTPHTAHTLSPVPCILLMPDFPACQLKPGKLADVAPTLLTLMGLEPAPEMDGQALIQSSSNEKYA